MFKKILLGISRPSVIFIQSHISPIHSMCQSWEIWDEHKRIEEKTILLYVSLHYGTFDCPFRSLQESDAKWTNSNKVITDLNLGHWAPGPCLHTFCVSSPLLWIPINDPVKATFQNGAWAGCNTANTSYPFTMVWSFGLNRVIKLRVLS